MAKTIIYVEDDDEDFDCYRPQHPDYNFVRATDHKDLMIRVLPAHLDAVAILSDVNCKLSNGSQTNGLEWAENYIKTPNYKPVVIISNDDRNEDKAKTIGVPYSRKGGPRDMEGAWDDYIIGLLEQAIAARSVSASPPPRDAATFKAEAPVKRDPLSKSNGSASMGQE